MLYPTYPQAQTCRVPSQSSQVLALPAHANVLPLFRTSGFAKGLSEKYRVTRTARQFSCVPFIIGQTDTDFRVCFLAWLSLYGSSPHQSIYPHVNNVMDNPSKTYAY